MGKVVKLFKEKKGDKNHPQLLFPHVVCGQCDCHTFFMEVLKTGEEQWSFANLVCRNCLNRIPVRLTPVYKRDGSENDAE